MRRLTRVLDDSTPDVNHASSVQSPIRVLLPPETSTFMAKVQVPAKASVDESLLLCSETHELGEEIVASYLYQIHLYHWLETNDYGRSLADNDL